MKGLLVICLFISGASFGQLLSGDLLDEGRRMVSPKKFVIESRTNGYLTYELAVNREGKVTSARMLNEQSNVKSTPAQIDAYKYVTGLKFEPGTSYPQFHHVVVKITLVRPKE